MDLPVRLTRERGTAALLVTHDLERLEGTEGLERVARLRDGRLAEPVAA